MTHRQAVLTMLVATFLWSIAGVVTRQLDAARSFEVTFWRSAANAVALTLILGWQRTPAGLLRALRDGGAILWVSGLCWTVMFTAFMVALTLTTVANVLVTMALGRCSRPCWRVSLSVIACRSGHGPPSWSRASALPDVRQRGEWRRAAPPHRHPGGSQRARGRRSDVDAPAAQRLAPIRMNAAT